MRSCLNKTTKMSDNHTSTNFRAAHFTALFDTLYIAAYSLIADEILYSGARVQKPDLALGMESTLGTLKLVFGTTKSSN